MSSKVRFQGKTYEIQHTLHSPERMEDRRVSQDMVVEIIETGTARPKKAIGKFWIYKELAGRADNLICLSISFEEDKAVLITVMHNWRPE